MTTEERISILEELVCELSFRNFTLTEQTQNNSGRINDIYDGIKKNTESSIAISETLTKQANLIMDILIKLSNVINLTNGLNDGCITNAKQITTLANYSTNNAQSLEKAFKMIGELYSIMNSNK